MCTGYSVNKQSHHQCPTDRTYKARVHTSVARRSLLDVKEARSTECRYGARAAQRALNARNAVQTVAARGAFETVSTSERRRVVYQYTV